MDHSGQNPTCYDLLQLHPAAPLDLITAVYWRLAGTAQAARSTDPEAAAVLHALTRAYEVLADHSSRAAYDRSQGIGVQQTVPKLPKRRGRLFARFRMKPSGDEGVDYYEVLRVASTADPAVVTEAYYCLRDYYMRLVLLSSARPELIDLLEEAHAIISDAQRRRAYDEARSRREASGPASSRPAEVRPSTDSTNPPPPRASRREGERSKTGAQAQARPEVAKDRSAAGAASSPAEVIKSSAAGAPAMTASQRSRNAATGKAQKAGAIPSAPEQAAPATASERVPRAPLKGIRGGASKLARRLGSQFDTMRKREVELEHEVNSRRGHDRAEERDAEEALTQRLAVRSAAGWDPPNTVGQGRFKVELVDGPGSGIAFDLKGFPVTLGADGECDVSVPAFGAQRAHLLFREGLFLVKVEGAPGATEGSDVPAEWWVLESGEDFRLGSCILRLSAQAD